MENSKKMALIPHQLVSSLLAQQQLNPNLAKLSSLDHEMKSVLDDSSVPADLKYKHYNQVLHRYMNLRDQELKPTPIQLKDTTPLPTLPPINILEGMPKKNMNQASLLLQHVQQNPNITWNDQQEVIINGQKIPNSNIVDLIHDFSRSRKTVTPAIGWREFATALKNSNISREAIVNKNRLEPVLAVSSGTFYTPGSSIKRPLTLGGKWWSLTTTPRYSGRVFHKKWTPY